MKKVMLFTRRKLLTIPFVSTLYVFFALNAPFFEPTGPD
jgi:hypothetical protein